MFKFKLIYSQITKHPRYSLLIRVINERDYHMYINESDTSEYIKEWYKGSVIGGLFHH